MRKTKDGKPTGDHPSKGAVWEFFQKVDSDPEWFPGKHSDEPRGPKRVLRGPKLTAIVSAAKRLKAEGTEPTYSVVVAACPKATLNPATGQPVDKNLIYTVFREACYDEDPNDTWDHLSRLSKTHSPSDRGEISLNIKGWSLAGEGLDRANWRWSGVPCCDVGSAS